MARRIRGLVSTRRVLRNLPDAMRSEIADILDTSGRKILAAMKAKTPERTGALRRGLMMRLLRRTLKLQVGYLGSKRGRSRLFYGNVLEFGRRAQTVTVSRRRKGAPTRLIGGRKPAEDVVSVYQLRVRPLAPRRIVTGSYRDLRAELNSKLQAAFQRALGTITGGSDV